MIQSVFVYGTLKRGQCRAACWPREPLSVCEAWTWACLYGRSDYPAMTAGRNRVLGELWKFPADRMAEVLAKIDQVEGTNQPGQEDLYVRVAIKTWSREGQPKDDAFAYRYATDPLADGFALLQPEGPDEWVRWPSDRQPSST